MSDLVGNPEERFPCYLAHLQGELVVYPCSGVRRRLSLSVCSQQCSNIFSSKTAWPIKAKFYVKPPWEGGIKVCINGLGHMTRMAATPIYDKKALIIFFSRTESPMILKLGMQHLGLKL